MSSAKKPLSASKPTGAKPSGRFTTRAPSKSVTVVVGKPLAPKATGKMAARAGLVLSHPKPAKAAAAVHRMPGFAFSPDPLLAAVMRRVQLAPGVARSLKDDFRRLLDAQLLRPVPAGARTGEAEDPVLSTQEAAGLAGVSRPFLVARIDAGDIPLHLMAGNQRRVLRSAVLAWKKQFRQGQLRALGKLGAELDEEIFPG